ncbi:MAG: hypothetical protein Q7R89_01120 [bacterium]|nr:hypothetical protein [bacterium]
MRDIHENEMHMPIDLRVRDGKYYVVSAILPRQNLNDPFFLDSLSYRFAIAEVNKNKPEEQSALVRPLHYDENDSRLEYIPIEDFINTFSKETIVEDKLKFIFHMSRCGSTLATQMLATSKRFFVVSEPTIILALLDPALILTDDYSKTNLLKAVICAIESCKPDNTEFTFIKFRSWNTLFLKDIVTLYSYVQWAFVHREGTEVLESVLRDPPGWLRAKITETKFFASALGLDVRDFLEIKDDEYAIRLLGTFCSNAYKNRSDRSVFIDYTMINTYDFIEMINSKWNLQLNSTEKENMFDTTKIYSKDPKKSTFFKSDSLRKQASASDRQKNLCQTFIEPWRANMNKA